MGYYDDELVSEMESPYEGHSEEIKYWTSELYPLSGVKRSHVNPYQGYKSQRFCASSIWADSSVYVEPIFYHSPAIHEEDTSFERLFVTYMSQRIRPIFEKLAAEWRDATAFMSSVTEIATHPSYQMIIGLGETVLPLIFESLQREADHWFWALKSITREDPVKPEDRGDLQKMAEAWLKWAIIHNYLSVNEPEVREPIPSASTREL